MKFFKSSLNCVVAVFVLLSTFAALYFTCHPHKWYAWQDETDAYIFPITPTKTPEKWKEFQTYQEMLNACQVPEEKLKIISTEGLIETCINYPLFANFMLSDSFAEGYQTLCLNFNGLLDLYKRNDYVEKRLSFFVSIDINMLKKQNVNAPLIYRWCCMMISKNDFIEKLNKQQQQQLLQSLNSQIENIRKNHTDFYSEITPLFVKLQVFKHRYDDFNDFCMKRPVLRTFVETGRWPQVVNNEYENLLAEINSKYG